MTSIDFSSQSILIVGAGKEGLSSLRYIRTKYPDARITITDQQAVEFNPLGATTLFGAQYPTEVSAWDVVIVSPGVLPYAGILDDARMITTPTNIFFEECKGTVIGVTGSKGKSTTSSLVFDILQLAQQPVRLVGNIGVPALDALLERNSQNDIYIYELSSYQCARLEHGPDTAVITNLFPEHIDYHGSVEQYYDDKLRITRTQAATQHVIFNATVPELVGRMNISAAQQHPYPSITGVHVKDDAIFFDEEKIISVNDIPLLGEHNFHNVLAAITVAKQYGVENKTIQNAIRAFQPLPHRLECIGTFYDITFYDDAISTSPESTIAAIHCMPQPIGTIFLGGQNRGYDFSELARVIKEKQIPNIVFFPYSGADMQQALEKIGYAPRNIHTSSMEEAVQFAYKHTPTNTIALLSCASPSYSIFKNFEDKGDQFQYAVRAYANA